MAGWDYREASTSDLIKELIVPTTHKSGYERLLLDVIRDRLWILDALERYIKDTDLHIDDQYSPDEAYAKMRDGATLGDIADMISDFSVFYIELKLIASQTDPGEVKKRVRTKYEVAANADQ